MEYFALSVVGLVIFAALAVVIDSFFLHIGAKMAVVKRSSFRKAVKASIACALSTFLLAIIFSWIPVVGTGVGFLLGLGLTIVVLQATYNTSFVKAFLLWIFNVFAQILALFVGGILLSVFFQISG